MKITKLIKIDSSKYEVIIDDKAYEIDEDVIVQYRLLAGKEITAAELQVIINANNIQKFINKAINYQFRYGKSAKEVVNYLISKEVDSQIAYDIVYDLVNKNIFNDTLLANNLASSYARASNGKNVIRYKLKLKLFKDYDIEMALDSISKEDIELGRDKILKKAQRLYNKFPDNIKNQKIKEYLYRHGY